MRRTHECALPRNYEPKQWVRRIEPVLLLQLRRHMRRNQFQQRGMHLRCTDADVAFVLVFTTRKIADHAAGFGDHQHTGGGVLRCQTQLPETIHAASGYMGEVQCR